MPTAHDITESARMFVAGLPEVSTPEPAKPLDPRAVKGIARAQARREAMERQREATKKIVADLTVRFKLSFLDIAPRKRGERGITVAYTSGRIATVSTAVFNPKDRSFDKWQGRYLAAARLSEGTCIKISLPERDVETALRTMFFPY